MVGEISEREPKGVVEFRELLFEDYFTSNWSRRKWTEVLGTWGVTSDGTYCCSTDTSLQRTVLKGLKDWTDYTVEARLKWVDNDNGGVLFRVQDTRNAYLVWVTANNTTTLTTARLYKMVDTALTQIGSDSTISSYGWSTSEFVKFKITVSGYTTAFYINDTLIFTIEDTNKTYHFGGVGLYASVNQNMEFDDLRVYRVKQTHENDENDVYNLEVEQSVGEYKDACTINMLAPKNVNPVRFVAHQVELQINDCGDEDAVSGWSVTYDALAAVADTTYFKEQSTSIKCESDVSLDPSNTAYWIYAPGGINISDIMGATSGNPTKGYLGWWTYVDATAYDNIPAGTAVRFRVGNDSGNCVSFTVTKANLRVGWNYFLISAATSATGTPNWTSINYVSVVVVNDSTDDFSVYFDDVRLFNSLDLKYQVSLPRKLKEVVLYRWERANVDGSTSLTQVAAATTAELTASDYFYEHVERNVMPIPPDCSVAYKVVVRDVDGKTYVNWFPRPPAGEANSPDEIIEYDEVSAKIGYEQTYTLLYCNSTDKGSDANKICGNYTDASYYRLGSLIWLDDLSLATSAKLRVYVTAKNNNPGPLYYTINGVARRTFLAQASVTAGAWNELSIPLDDLVEGYNFIVFDANDAPDDATNNTYYAGSDTTAGTITDYLSRYDSDGTADNTNFDPEDFTLDSGDAYLIELEVTYNRLKEEFLGKIDEITPTFSGGVESLDIFALDYKTKLKEYEVSHTILNGTEAGQAVKDVIGSIEGCKIGVKHVEDTNIVLPEMKFDKQKLDGVLASIAESSVSKFRLDPDGNLIFYKSLFTNVEDPQSLLDIDVGKYKGLKLRAFLAANDDQTASPQLEDWSLYANGDYSTPVFTQTTAEQFENTRHENVVFDTTNDIVTLAQDLDSWSGYQTTGRTLNQSKEPDVKYYNDGTSRGFIMAFANQLRRRPNDDYDDSPWNIDLDLASSATGDNKSGTTGMLLPIEAGTGIDETMKGLATKRRHPDKKNNDGSRDNSWNDEQPAVCAVYDSAARGDVHLFFRRRKSATDINIYWNKYDKSGDAVRDAQESETAFTSANNCHHPSAIEYDDNGTNKVLVVYARDGNGLYYRLSSNANPAVIGDFAAETQIIDNTYGPKDPCVIQDGDGFLWIFFTATKGFTTTGETDLKVYYVKNTTAYNEAAWNTPIEVPNVNGVGKDMHPHAAYDPISKEIMLVWSRNTSELSETARQYDIYQSRSPDGVNWSPPRQLGGGEYTEKDYKKHIVKQVRCEVDVKQIWTDKYGRITREREWTDPYRLTTNEGWSMASSNWYVNDNNPCVAFNNIDGRGLCVWDANNEIGSKGFTQNLCRAHTMFCSDGLIESRTIYPNPLTCWNRFDPTFSRPDVGRFVYLERCESGDPYVCGFSLNNLADAMYKTVIMCFTSAEVQSGIASLFIDGGGVETVNFDLQLKSVSGTLPALPSKTLDLSSTGWFDCQTAAKKGKFGLWYYPNATSQALYQIKLFASGDHSTALATLTMPSNLNVGQWNKVLWDIYTGSGNALSAYTDVDYITLTSKANFEIDDFEWAQDVNQGIYDFDTADIYDSSNYVGQTFTTGASVTNLTKIIVYGRKVGTPADSLYCRLYLWNTNYATSIAGTCLADCKVSASSIGTSDGEITFYLGASGLSASTKYLLHFTMYTDGTNGNEYVLMYSSGFLANADLYNDGVIVANADLYLKTYYMEGGTAGTTDLGAWKMNYCTTKLSQDSSNKIEGSYCLKLDYDYGGTYQLCDCESTINWSQYGLDDSDNPEIDTTYKMEGTSGIKLPWTTVTNDAYWDFRNPNGWDLSGSTEDALTFWMYVDDLTALQDGWGPITGGIYCFGVNLLKDDGTNLIGWALGTSDLKDGWNRIIFNMNDAYVGSKQNLLSNKVYRIKFSVSEVASSFITVDNVRIENPVAETALREFASQDWSSYNKIMFWSKCDSTNDTTYINEIQVGLSDGTDTEFKTAKAVLWAMPTGLFYTEWVLFEVDLHEYTLVDKTGITDFYLRILENAGRKGGSGTVYFDDIKVVNDNKYYIDEIFLYNELEAEGSSSVSFDILDEDGNIVEKTYGSVNSIYDLKVGVNVKASDYRIERGDDVNEVEVIGATPQITAKIRDQEDIDKTGTIRSISVERPYIRSNYAAFLLARLIASMKNKLGVAATLETVGVPELRVGRITKLTGLWKQLTDRHLISNVKRKLDENGYLISMNLGKERQSIISLLGGALQWR